MPRDGTTADTVVVELEARLGNYQSQVNQGANAFDRSMQQIASSATAAERSTGQAFTAISGHAGNARVAQQMLMHVSRSTADQFAAGAPPMMIFSGHLAQLAEAATFAGGSMGKVGEFLGGPWGIAVTVAASVMATLIGKFMESGDATAEAVKKLQEHARQTEEAEKAQRIFGSTLDGVTDALHKNRNAIDQLDAGQKSAARSALENAIAAKMRLEGIRNETQALITQARTMLEVERIRATAPGQRGEIASLGLPERSSALDSLETRLGTITTNIAEADRQIQSALSHRVVELQGRDQIQKINDRYDGLIDRARSRAVAEKTVSTELSRQVNLLNDQRKAEIKRAQEAARPARHGNNSLTGREVTPAEAAGIARAAGLQVNSSSRTYGQQKALYDAWVAKGMPKDNPVAVPGSSAHEGARGRWALDIQFGQGVTPELLRKVFADQGISLSKVFKERGHFHVEGSRAQADAAQASLDRDKPKYTAAQMRDQFEIDNYDPKAPMKLFDSEDLAADFEKITGIKAATTDIAGMIATFPPLPDFSKIITEEEQQRIDDWVLNLKQDLASGLTDAIAEGKNLGDVLVNTFKRAAAALLESGLLNMLTGGKQGVSFGHMISSLNGLFGGNKTVPLANTPGMASGGNVTGGTLYRVNESGVEGFRPAGSGTIIPLGQMAQAQGGSTTVVNTVNVHANDAVLADTVRGWVMQGMQEAAMKGAMGGRALTIDHIRRQNRRRLS